MTNTPTPAPGWYAAPHANGEQRYWDGARWTDWTPESAAAARAAAAEPTTPLAPQQVDAPTATAVAEPQWQQPQKKGLRWWAWVLIGLVGLILLIIIIGSANAGSRNTENDAAPRPVATEGTVADEQEDAEAEADTRVDTPDVVGMTVAEARAELEDAGMVVKLVKGTGDDWIVKSQTITVPADPGTEILIVAEKPEPVYTLAQQNAIEQAKSYLRFTGFSRLGLVEQLEYEGYSREDAVFGADHSGANWKAEAAEKAESYLETSSFSRQGLYDQLQYEQFTEAEIQYALSAVGY